jgi:hypothetical protein
MTKMKKKECKLIQRPANSRLAQWRVTLLVVHSTSHQHLWCIDSFVLPCLPAGKSATAPSAKTLVHLWI